MTRWRRPHHRRFRSGAAAHQCRVVLSDALLDLLAQPDGTYTRPTLDALGVANPTPIWWRHGLIGTRIGYARLKAAYDAARSDPVSDRVG